MTTSVMILIAVKLRMNWIWIDFPGIEEFAKWEEELLESIKVYIQTNTVLNILNAKYDTQKLLSTKV